jgi:hypothetical protein
MRSQGCKQNFYGADRKANERGGTEHSDQAYVPIALHVPSASATAVDVDTQTREEKSRSIRANISRTRTRTMSKSQPST